jgi:hypothetical protein
MDHTDSRFAPSPEPASDDVASPSEFQPPVPATDSLAFEPAPLRLRRDGLTPAKQREFVEALADCGLVREAAARIGISEQAISRVRRRSDAADFDRACEAAQLFGARRLRSIAWERAVEGTIKHHYYRGELVGQERVYDNRLLIYLLGKTGHLLEPSEAAKAVRDNWQPCMEALERGTPPEPVGRASEPPEPEDEEDDGENPQVWREDGVWWTIFPPPEGFDGDEEGKLGDQYYQRTLTEEEEAAMEAREQARDEAELARCCAVRDRYFGLPPRGSQGYFPRLGSPNNETSDPRRHPGEGRDPGETRGATDLPSAKPVITPPTSKPPSPGILADEPPGAST